LKDEIASVISGFKNSSVTNLNLSSSASLPCIGTFTYNSISKTVCLSDYESQLSGIPNVIIFLAYFFSAIIILRR